MSQQQDDALEVLRTVWDAQGQSGADLDEECGTRSCQRMAGINFDGMAGSGEDLRSAWRARLASEGKLNTAGGSVRDLVLGPPDAS
jgi:hypothetical protein